MITYHKIQSIFKRDEHSHKFILYDYSIPEFEYLANNQWEFTEKIDGTNIRIGWNCEEDKISIGGRTENAQIPSFLYDKLQLLFPIEKFRRLYSDISMTLIGEGFGAKIQKGGKYIPDGVDFILFDVYIDGIYLERHNVADIAQRLKIQSVPVIGYGNLLELLAWIKNGTKSKWGDFLAEGIVARPITELQDRRGNRIITKIKHKDI